jgi:hypothetical protein
VITAEAKLAATAVSQLASSNAERWVFENARIGGLLAMLGSPTEAELRRVFTSDGRLVAEQGRDVAPPVMAATSPVFDSGAVVGWSKCSARNGT